MRRSARSAGSLLAASLLLSCQSAVHKPPDQPMSSVADLVDYRTGMMMLQEGRVDEALILFHRARAAYPNEPAVPNGLGLALLYRKDYPGAIKAFGEALWIDPGYTDALNNRGVAYIEIGRFDEAMADFQTVLDKAPNPGVLSARLNRGLLFSKKQDWVSAERELSLVLIEDPGNWRALRERGLVRMRVDDFGGALDDFLRVLKDDPKDTLANYNAALCLLTTGRRDLAVRYMKRVAASSPDSEEGKKARRFLASEPEGSRDRGGDS